mgnify:CR=1 FL=1
MKRILLILLSVMLVACSPQKRLARLVERHPELVADTTIVVSVTDTVVIERTESTVTVLTDTVTVPVRVEAANAMATLTPIGGGVFELKAETLPDTIIIHTETPITVSQLRQDNTPTRGYRFFHHAGVFYVIATAAALLIYIILEGLRLFTRKGM